MPVKVKKAIFVSAGIIAITAVVLIVIQLAGIFKAENNSITVYKKGVETVVRIGDTKKSISDLTAADFKCDKESGRVFYVVESSYSDSLFDLYFIEKNRSEISEPKIIDIGVRNDYDVVEGKVYYLKKNVSAGAFEGCVCDIEKNKIETFSGNVENIFTLDAQTVYFTKMHGSNRVLYRYDGVETTEVCRELSNIMRYGDCESPHVIYEKRSSINSGMTELFIAYPANEPVMICDNTYYVMYDDYAPGGNLYYFTSSTESVSWSYVIADQYSETDPLIEKPVRNDFLSILGISAEYNEAFKAYQDKLIRDEIRAALNESVENGDFSVPVFNAFSYSEKGTYMIAEDIDPKNVYAVSAFGAPKIIFESTEVLPSDTDMGTLVEIAQRSEMREVIEYAKSIVEECVKSEGMAYAAYGEKGAVSSLIDGYDKSKTLFSFSKNGERLFAFVRESQGERLNVYTNGISEKLDLNESIGVDTGVSSYSFSGDSVIYLKSDRNKLSGDVFNYNGKESVKISNSANAFTVEDNKDVIILKNHKSDISGQTADYYVVRDGEEKLINSDILVDSFKYADSGYAAYISQSGEINIFGGEKSVSVDDEVTEILLFC
ncbi:MAG: hypothetical protein IJO03_02120 [Clostridia bacterium]|nr:hypothetical protein [Clostridia bacterium]